MSNDQHRGQRAAQSQRSGAQGGDRNPQQQQQTDRNQQRTDRPARPGDQRATPRPERNERPQLRCPDNNDRQRQQPRDERPTTVNALVRSASGVPVSGGVLQATFQDNGRMTFASGPIDSGRAQFSSPNIPRSGTVHFEVRSPRGELLAEGHGRYERRGSNLEFNISQRQGDLGSRQTSTTREHTVHSPTSSHVRSTQVQTGVTGGGPPVLSATSSITATDETADNSGGTVDRTEETTTITDPHREHPPVLTVEQHIRPR